LKLRIRYLEPRTAILLEELGEERQRVLKLLAQLELLGLQEEQVDQLLGELSAAILHLHSMSIPEAWMSSWIGRERARSPRERVG